MYAAAQEDTEPLRGEALSQELSQLGGGSIPAENQALETPQEKVLHPQDFIDSRHL